MVQVSTYRQIICSIFVRLLCNLLSCMLHPDEEVTRTVSFADTEVLKPYKTISPVREDLKKFLKFLCQ